MASYDLTTRRWIRARRADGSLGEFSLRTVFAEAPTLRGLAGELPTQDAAVLRLLLAILYRVLEQHLDVADRHAAWAQLWQRRGQLPHQAVDRYLDRYQHRFDLLAADRPFMQVANLRTAKDEDFGLERLIGDMPTGEPFFTTRAGGGLESIETAEAARWLVHCHAFDPSGIKSGALGDTRVKGGKGYPIGCGWAGQIGLVLVEGVSLAETLLLNLVPPRDTPIGLPIWEREDGHTSSTDATHPVPTSRVDTLVWQSRRVRLIGDEHRIRRVLICNGDPFSPQNRWRLEASSGWRRSEAQEKKLKLPEVYMPRLHPVGRAIWRGLEPLLATVVTTATGAAHRSPRVLEWLAELRESDCLAGDYVMRVRTVGLVYGSNNSVVDSQIDDVVALHAAVLSDLELHDAAVTAVRHADGAVRALADLADDLARAAGGDPTGPKARAYTVGYQVLDRAYRQWLFQLAPGVDVPSLLVAWDSQIEDLLRPISADLIDAAGTPAFLGRMVERGGKSALLDSGKAAGNYWWRLRQALPQLPQPPTVDKESVMPGEPMAATERAS